MARKTLRHTGGDEMEDDILGDTSGDLRDERLFRLTLEECGCIMQSSTSSAPHLFKHQPRQVVTKLNNILETDLAHPKKAKDIIAGLKDFLEEKEANLVKALSPSEVEETSQQCDSVVRTLLQVDDLQGDLASYLLEKLVLVSMEGSGDSRVTHESSQTPMSIPTLILSQLRYLNHVVDGAALADKMMEILQAAPNELQRDVISALPEIVEESHHSKFAMVLRDLMRDNKDLTSVVLHAFTYLSISSTIRSEVRDSIMKTLSLCPIEDLPVMVQFILEDVEKGEEFFVLSEFRDQLSFSSSQMMTQLSQSKSKRKNGASNEDVDIDIIVMQILKVNMFTNKALCEGWLKVIESAQRNLKTVDILVLVILHSMPTRRKAAESLLKNKIRSGILSEELLSITFKTHGIALKAYFENILAMADMLCQSVEPSLRKEASKQNHFALTFYQAMFLDLDRFCKQEIIADLVMKCGLNTPSRPTALKGLHYLVFEYTDEVMRYASFLENILEHSTSLALSDYRQVMDMLFYLAYCGEASNGIGTMRNNLHIVITKQVSSTNPKLIRLGVTGAVVAVKNMARCKDDNVSMTQGASSSSASPISMILRKAKQILQVVHAKSKGSGPIGGLFMDELSSVIGATDVERNLQKYIADTMTNDFTDDFVVDVNTDGTIAGLDMDNGFLPMQSKFGLVEDNNIALNLCPLVLKSLGIGNGGYQCSRATRMIPHFRLLKICIACHSDNDLSEIDALLSCPIIMPHDGVIDKFESLTHAQQNVVCNALFYCANWFRELINAFAEQNDAEYRQQVLNRLKALLVVNRHISNCLQYNTGFCPPVCFHAADVSWWKSPGSLAGKKGNKGKQKERKGKRKRHPSDNSDAGNDLTGEPQVINLDYYSPFFRELDVSVFTILSYDTVALGSEPRPEDEEKDPKIRPKDLLFLLRDLSTKLKHRLIPKRAKKRFVGKFSAEKDAVFSHIDKFSESEVAAFAVKLLDYLMGNLDEVAKFFKRMIAINDGIQDALAMFGESSSTLCDIFEEILNCTNTVLAWNGFQSKDERALLKEALHKIGSRYNAQLSQVLSVQELALATFNYMSRFHAEIVSAATAHSHLRLLETIADIDGLGPSQQKALAEIAGIYLRRDWLNPCTALKDRGAAYNGHVENILNTFLGHSEDIDKALCTYVDEELLRVAEAKERSSESNEFPTLNKKTLGLHFRGLFHFLTIFAKKLEFSQHSVLTVNLDNWTCATHILTKLIGVIRHQNGRLFIGSTLKYSRVFLDQFLRNGMTVVDKLFQSRRQDCIDLLKQMQKNTRFLHHVCLHSKGNKDATLARHVPLLKRSLEAFVYRVKEMLVKNDALEAFWLGVLKNRDLSGEEILSQPSSDVDSNNDDDGDQDLPEEEQSDIDMNEKDDAECDIATQRSSIEADEQNESPVF